MTTFNFLTCGSRNCFHCSHGFSFFLILFSFSFSLNERNQMKEIKKGIIDFQAKIRVVELQPSSQQLCPPIPRNPFGISKHLIEMSKQLIEEMSIAAKL